jgi:hypothetical protein
MYVERQLGRSDIATTELYYGHLERDVLAAGTGDRRGDRRGRGAAWRALPGVISRRRADARIAPAERGFWFCPHQLLSEFARKTRLLVAAASPWSASNETGTLRDPVRRRRPGVARADVSMLDLGCRGRRVVRGANIV